MFHSFKNCKIKLNDNEYLCTDAQVSVNSNLTPVYLQNNRHSNRYANQNGVEGNLRLNYLLTGSDPAKLYITGDNYNISGNIGGLFFRSGYLRGYNLSATPNSPATVNSEFVFYEQLSGDFTPQTPVQNEDFNILNFCDATLTPLANYSEESFDNVVSINYSFTADIKPVYTMQTGTGYTSIAPTRVAFGAKEVNTEIVVDALSGYMPLAGKNAGLTLNFRHPNLSTLNESFTCSGVLYQRNIQSSIDNLIRPSISIKQNNFDDKTYTISNFAPEQSNDE